jgi:hypothetical protein
VGRRHVITTEEATIAEQNATCTQVESRFKTGEHTIRIALCKLCVTTLHRLIFGRFLQSCARLDSLSASGAAAASAAAARRPSSIHVADSAFASAIHFCHPASAESELEHHLYTVLINLGAPHSALSRATVSYLAEFLLRALYGPAAEFARELKFAGHHAAAMELRLLWNAVTASWSHTVSLQLAGVAEHLHTLADVDSAHEQGVFSGRAHSLCRAAAGGEEPLAWGSKRAAKGRKQGRDTDSKLEVQQACVMKRVTRACTAPRRSARVAAAAAVDGETHSGKHRQGQSLRRA